MQWDKTKLFKVYLLELVLLLSFGPESDRLIQWRSDKLHKEDNGTKPNRAKLLPLGGWDRAKKAFQLHDSHKWERPNFLIASSKWTKYSDTVIFGAICSTPNDCSEPWLLEQLLRGKRTKFDLNEKRLGGLDNWLHLKLFISLIQCQMRNYVTCLLYTSDAADE